MKLKTEKTARNRMKGKVNSVEQIERQLNCIY